MAPTILHADRKEKEQLAIDDTGRVTWTRGGTPVKFTAVADRQPKSFHYPDQALFAVQDMRGFVRGAKEISERAMQWTAGDANARYREAVRFGDRVLLVWGRNNARNLQSVGITAGEADAKALVQAFRASPLKGFAPTSPYFVEGRGGVVREYYPVPERGTLGKVERGRGSCIDNRVEWTTSYPKYEREVLVEEKATDEAAEKRFDALELDWYQRGGRPYEIEWMKTQQRRSFYSIREWVLRQGKRPDAKAFATKLIKAAKLDLGPLPSSFAEINQVLRNVPAAWWVRVGEVVGKISKKPGPKPNTELLLDHALFVVATVKRDKQGVLQSVIVKRAKSASGAKLLFGK